MDWVSLRDRLEDRKPVYCLLNLDSKGPIPEQNAFNVITCVVRILGLYIKQREQQKETADRENGVNTESKETNLPNVSNEKCIHKQVVGIPCENPERYRQVQRETERQAQRETCSERDRWERETRSETAGVPEVRYAT